MLRNTAVLIVKPFGGYSSRREKTLKTHLDSRGDVPYKYDPNGRYFGSGAQ
jgi:hypothetical protein